MYHAIVRRRVRGVFGQLSRGEWRDVLTGTAEALHHIFPGDHALGGERHSRRAVTRWFERLERLFPVHTSEVRRVAVRGWPWRTWVAVEWVGTLVPLVGEAYANQGSHRLEIRWGKVTGIHAYLDTQRVADACNVMVATGIEEAAAAPIVD
jgi:ketosteroid isomerase-like protein